MQSEYNVHMLSLGTSKFHNPGTDTEHVGRQGYVYTQRSSRVADIVISGHADGLGTYK